MTRTRRALRLPRRGRGAAATVLVAGLALLPAGCRGGREGPPAPPPAVTVARPATVPVTEYLEMTGTVGASRSVNLVARVPGYLEALHFRDGDFVKEGQLLFSIERKPYEAQVQLQQAALVRAQAELDRQQAMMKENATAKTTMESWLSQRDQAQANLDLARINLGYTRVTAPFTGRIGARQVDPGNLVGSSGPTVLATLDQLRPIYVNFNLNERDALALRRMMEEQGVRVKSNVGKARVEVGLQSEQGYPHAGVLDFTDHAMSTSTGTLALRALLPNDDTALFPGLFARVRIPLGGPRPMLVVPGASVGSDQQGDYVLVAGPDDVVARRGVVRGPAADGGVAIRSGLEPADRVVVNGMLNARPGEKATVTEKP